MKKPLLQRFFSTSLSRSKKTPNVKPEKKQEEITDPSSEPKSDMDLFLDTYVNPAQEERRKEELLARQALEAKSATSVSSNPTTENAPETLSVIKKIPLPKDLWNRHILSRLPEETIRLFGEAYQSSPNIFNDFYNDSFNFKQFNPLPLFMQAKEDGVNVNIPLLHQLCGKPKAYLSIQPLHFENNCTWVIAALCGDINWLLDKFGPTFTQLSTKYKGYQRNILYFLTFSGHLNIIKGYFSSSLLALRDNTSAMQELNHNAASSGFFEICDFLEEKFDVSPYLSFVKQSETTIHFYAFYGDLDRLKKAIVKKRDLLTRFAHGRDLLFSAVKGGNVTTVRFLVNGKPEVIKKPVEFTGDTCFHIATENGHADLLKLFINEFFCKPPQETATARKDILLTRCGISASWDCFWILYPYFQSHPQLRQSLGEIPMFAIGANHVDFFDQFVSKFGKTFEGIVRQYGQKISHSVLFSSNLTTIRKMINEYNLDLTEQNDNGEIALLYLATIAADQKSDLSWYVVSSIFNEFNHQFGDRLHLIPDNTGMTLEQLIIQQGKQDLFTELSPEMMRPHTLTSNL
jgi:hypothetical protein